MTNEEKVASVFPETWTHTANINWAHVGWRLKIIGAWPAGMELATVLARCEELKIVLRDGMLVRRNNNPPRLPV